MIRFLKYYYKIGGTTVYSVYELIELRKSVVCLVGESQVKKVKMR